MQSLGTRGPWSLTGARKLNVGVEVISQKNIHVSWKQNNTTQYNPKEKLFTSSGILDKSLHLSDPLLLTYTMRGFDR